MTLIGIQYKARNGGADAVAVRFTGQNGPELAKWCGGTYNISGKFKGPHLEDLTEVVQVPYKKDKGFLNAFKGDYVVKLNSDVYPLNSVAFHQLFTEKKD